MDEWPAAAELAAGDAEPDAPLDGEPPCPEAVADGAPAEEPVEPEDVEPFEDEPAGEDPVAAELPAPAPVELDAGKPSFASA